MASAGESSSIQEYAAHLLEVADVVHQSNHQKQVKLETLMSEGLFGSDSFTLDDSVRSAADSDVHATADAARAKSRSHDKKKAKSQKMAELKQQVLDCNKALLALRANADLKVRKLELQLADLKSNLESSRNELESAKTEIQRLEKNNQVMEGELHTLVDEGQAEWQKTIKRKSDVLEEELQNVKHERDYAIADNESMTNVMKICAQCVKKLPNRVPSARPIKVERPSLWNTFNTALQGLTAEAESIPTPIDRTHRTVSTSIKEPPQDALDFQEQSDQIKLNLEADIDALEKQTHHNAEALKSEGIASLSTSSSRRRKKQHGGKLAGDVSALDSFFAAASKGLSLHSEEMDEERSMFSASRSVSTAPVGNSHLKKKKASRRKEEKSSSNGRKDRRAGMTAASNFRQSFRASIAGLGEEVFGAAKGNTPNETNSDADET